MSTQTQPLATPTLALRNLSTPPARSPRTASFLRLPNPPLTSLALALLPTGRDARSSLGTRTSLVLPLPRFSFIISARIAPIPRHRPSLIYRRCILLSLNRFLLLARLHSGHHSIPTITPSGLPTPKFERRLPATLH